MRSACRRSALCVAVALWSVVAAGGADVTLRLRPVDSAQVRLTFRSEYDKAYRLESTAMGGGWGDTGTVIAGTGGTVRHEIATTGGSNAWFRLRFSPASPWAGRVFTNAPLGALEAAYDPAVFRQAALGLFDARFPDGSWIVTNLTDAADFDRWFFGATNTWEQFIRRLSTALHEGVHKFGFEHGDFWTTAYVLGTDRVETLLDLETFHRSEIYDELAPEMQAIGYADTYLKGSSGEQGLDSVLDEVNAYTYSLIVDTAVVDQFLPGLSRSSQDGLLTFLLYLEEYLRLARTRHPDDYAEILGSPGVPAFILTLWDRALFYLELSGDDPRLYIDAPTIRPHVFDPARVAEIERLWDAH
jgi:hypothetical protein